MADYHSVYKGPEGETTQWQDIQAKLGNYEKKEKPKKAAYVPEKEEVKDKEWLDTKDQEELEEMEDEFADDRFMEEYRQKRITELRTALAQPRFGSLQEIRRNEFVAQVTNAGEDVWVVVLLYKDSVEKCGILEQCFRELAPKYPGTKFLKILSTDCIPGYPDGNLPTVLLYRDTKCEQHIVGLVPWGSRFVTPEGVALMLNRYGNLCPAGDGSEGVSQQQVKELVKKLAEKREQEEADEDSDFDD